MSSVTPSTVPATKNGVFFLIGARPGDAEYAEHIRSALDALEQISQEDPEFKYRHVGSAQEGVLEEEWLPAFEEFAKECPDDNTLLISSPAKYVDGRHTGRHTVFLVPEYWWRSTWGLLASCEETISDDSKNVGRKLDTVLFTSGGYCPERHAGELPLGSRLLCFDTDETDTGSRFIADIVREAAKTTMSAEDIAIAASHVEHSAEDQRPSFQLSWRQQYDAPLQVVVERPLSYRSG